MISRVLFPCFHKLVCILRSNHARWHTPYRINLFLCRDNKFTIEFNLHEVKFLSVQFSNGKDRRTIDSHCLHVGLTPICYGMGMWHHLLTSELENVSKMRQLKFPSLWLSVYLSNFQISASTPGY